MLVTDFSIDDVVSEIKTLYCKPNIRRLQQPSVHFGPVEALSIALLHKQPALFVSPHLSIIWISSSIPPSFSSPTANQFSVLIFFSLLFLLFYFIRLHEYYPHQCALSYGPVLRLHNIWCWSLLLLLLLLLCHRLNVFLFSSTPPILKKWALKLRRTAVISKLSVLGGLRAAPWCVLSPPAQTFRWIYTSYNQVKRLHIDANRWQHSRKIQWNEHIWYYIQQWLKKKEY